MKRSLANVNIVKFIRRCECFSNSRKYLLCIDKTIIKMHTSKEFRWQISAENRTFSSILEINNLIYAQKSHSLSLSYASLDEVDPSAQFGLQKKYTTTEFQISGTEATKNISSEFAFSIDWADWTFVAWRVELKSTNFGKYSILHSFGFCCLFRLRFPFTVWLGRVFIVRSWSALEFYYYYYHHFGGMAFT